MNRFEGPGAREARIRYLDGEEAALRHAEEQLFERRRPRDQRPQADSGLRELERQRRHRPLVTGEGEPAPRAEQVVDPA